MVKSISQRPAQSERLYAKEVYSNLVLKSSENSDPMEVRSGTLAFCKASPPRCAPRTSLEVPALYVPPPADSFVSKPETLNQPYPPFPLPLTLISKPFPDDIRAICRSLSCAVRSK